MRECVAVPSLIVVERADAAGMEGDKRGLAGAVQVRCLGRAQSQFSLFGCRPYSAVEGAE
jgi:hypothetical protein